MNNYLQHFGLTHAPLGKQTRSLWDDGTAALARERFQWLLTSPGIGLLTGEPGVGKTALLRQCTQALNPHQYPLIYLSETDFGRLDLYRSLAHALGLEPAYRRAQLWRDLKARILDLADTRQQQLVWIIDEAQNLPREFFQDFPSFLNFAFDTRDLMTVWLVGQPGLSQTLSRAPYAALDSRIQVRIRLPAIVEPERFASLIKHAFKEAGGQQQLLSDSGIDLLRQASQGNPRHAGVILKQAMCLAVPKALNHLPDNLLEQAIEELR
ncbi:MAG: ATP-binding protein [Proteobacteria bacterium]|jgi:MSHA biogenesis protein MshM|nr:ATP-binding protein [Pseudomonadota bacterium]